MDGISVSLSVLRFSRQPFIRLTSHLVGVLLRTQESAVSSVKSFGRAFVEKTASKKHHPAELQSPRSSRRSSSKPTVTDLRMREFHLQSVTTLTQSNLERSLCLILCFICLLDILINLQRGKLNVTFLIHKLIFILFLVCIGHTFSPLNVN